MKYHRHQTRLIHSPSATDLVSQLRDSLVPSRPWDSIIDFATHRSFCGLKLFPRQQTLLKLIYLETETMTPYDIDVIDGWANSFNNKDPEGVQPDIWDRVSFLKERGYTHFPMVQAVMGRRASKGMIGGVIGAERMSYMTSLGDPQGHYGIDQDKDLFLFSLATNTVQAKMFQFADIKSIVGRNMWLTERISSNKDHYISLRTDSDVRRLAEHHGRGIDIESEYASIRALPISPSSSSARGAAAFAIFYDEFAFLLSNPDSANSDESVFSALQPSMDQIGKDSFTYVPSSPFSRAGYFYELYKQGRILLEEYQVRTKELIAKGKQDDPSDDEDDVKDRLMSDPEHLLVQLPSWALYLDHERGEELVGVKFRKPIQYPPIEETQEGQRMLRLEAKNPTKFKVERRAQFASVIDGYLNEELVDRIFSPLEGGRVLEQQSKGSMGFIYHGHSDPSRSNANFALAIAHLEDIPEPDKYGNKWKRVVFDKTHVWRPQDFPNGLVDYVDIFEDFKQILKDFRGLEKLTFDQWNCQAGSTLVSTDKGLLRLDEMVGSHEGKTESIDMNVTTKDGVAKAKVGFHKGITKTRKITTKLGNVIEVTPEHRIWAKKSKDKVWHQDNEWDFYESADIEVGDWLCLKRNTLASNEYVRLDSIEGWQDGCGWKTQLDESIGESMGLLLAEGDYNRGELRFGNSDGEVLQRYVDLMSDSFPSGAIKSGPKTFDWRVHGSNDPNHGDNWGIVRKGGRLATLMNNLGLTGASTDKVVPWSIRRSPKSVIASFLRGYFEGDGGICEGRPGEVWIEATTTSEDISLEIQQLLFAVGVWNTRWSGTYRHNGTVKKQWRIKIFGQDVIDFAEIVGFSGSHKKKSLDNAVSTILGSNNVGLRSKNQRHGDDYWVRVTSIEDGEADCYDLSVPGPETYLANGVVSHNSAMGIDSLSRFVKQERLATKIEEVTFSSSRNQDVAEKFKSALNLDWIRAPKDNLFNEGEGCLLETELKFLVERRGRIEKQSIGPCQTKDLADCFDSETEVLTDSGWKLFKDFSEGDLAATVNPHGEMEFQAPTHKIEKPYKGKMIKGSFEEMDFMVTPTHRMVSKKYKKGDSGWGEYEIVEAESLKVGRNIIPLAPLGVYELRDSQKSMSFGKDMPEPLENFGRLLWSEDQELFLEKNYNWMPMDEIIHAVGKSRSSIYNRARKMGLCRGQIGDRVLDKPDLPPEVNLPDFARFVGFWLGDGTKIVPGKQGWSVKISQTKPEGIQYLRDLLGRMKWEYKETQEAYGKTFCVKYSGLREYLYCLQEGSELRLPKDFMSWSTEAREGLWEGLTKADGCFRTGRYLSNTSKALLDDAQALLLSLGRGSTINLSYEAGQHRNPIRGRNVISSKAGYKLSTLSRGHTETRPHSIQEVDYEGMVYCLTVPNGTLVVRRNSRPLVAGNCVMETSVRLLQSQFKQHSRVILGSSRINGAIQGQYPSAMGSSPNVNVGRYSEQGAARRGRLSQLTRGRSHPFSGR